MIEDSQFTERFNAIVKLDWYDIRLRNATKTLASGLSGIAFAGGLYPAMVSSVGFATALLANGNPLGGATLIEISEGCMAFLMMLGFGFVIGGIYAFFCSAIGLPIVACFNASMSFPFNARTQIGVLGGLSGFIATCPVAYAMTINSAPPLVATMGYGIVALAMAMGQIGAVRTASSSSNWVTFVIDNHPIRLPTDRGPQIQLKQCFVLTTWIAGVLGLARLIGFDALVSVVFYVVMQTILLAADAAWVSWRKRRAPQPSQV